MFLALLQHFHGAVLLSEDFKMYIKVESLLTLCEKYPELEIVRNITANHGEETEISLLCELLAKAYERIDALTAPVITSSSSPKTKV